MKYVKFRINCDYIINAVTSGLLLVTGMTVFGITAYVLYLLAKEIDAVPTDNEYEVLGAIFFIPLLVFAFVSVFAIGIALGFLPAVFGLVIGALSSIARFAHTEKGTAITKPYKVLMSISNGMTCGALALYAFAVASLLFSLISNSSYHFTI